MQLTPKNPLSLKKYSTCQGDSGGPLVVNAGSQRKLLAGITSWGIGCGDRRHPGVYARVSHFSEWINQAKIVTDRAVPSQSKKSFVIASNLTLKSYSAKMFDVMIPRGLRLAKFVLQSAHISSRTGTFFVNIQGLDGFACYQSDEPNSDQTGRTKSCIFYMPLEGIFTLTVASEIFPIERITLLGVFESFQQPRHAVYTLSLIHI